MKGYSGSVLGLLVASLVDEVENRNRESAASKWWMSLAMRDKQVDYLCLSGGLLGLSVKRACLRLHRLCIIMNVHHRGCLRGGVTSLCAAIPALPSRPPLPNVSVLRASVVLRGIG